MRAKVVPLDKIKEKVENKDTLWLEMRGEKPFPVIKWEGYLYSPELPTQKFEEFVAKGDEQNYNKKFRLWTRCPTAKQMRKEKWDVSEASGTYQCFHCGEKSVVWDSDFTFEDMCRDGDGIVHVCHCENCGAEIEYYISCGEEDA